MKTNYNKELFDELKDMRKSAVDALAKKSLTDAILWMDLLNIALNPEKDRHWRAAWVLQQTASENPDLFYPHLERILAALPEIKYHTHLGCWLDILPKIKADLSEHAYLIDMSVEILRNQDLPAYIKWYAIKVMGYFVELEPDLAPEIKDIINTYWPLVTQNKYLTERVNELMKRLTDPQ